MDVEYRLSGEALFPAQVQDCKAAVRWIRTNADKYGLDPNEALKAITLNPAKLIGMEDRIGSLERGKDADLVIFDGDPFDIQTKVLKTFINGKLVYSADQG